MTAAMTYFILFKYTSFNKVVAIVNAVLFKTTYKFQEQGED